MASDMLRNLGRLRSRLWIQPAVADKAAISTTSGRSWPTTSGAEERMGSKVDHAAALAKLNKFPMHSEYPGIPVLKPAGQLPTPQMRITTLPSGLRVASEENYSQVSCIGMFVDAGSKYETDEIAGMHHLLESLAFGNTTTRSVSDLATLCQQRGITTWANASREHFLYRVEALRGFAEDAIGVLADTVQRPEVSDSELDRARTLMNFQVLDVANDQTVVMEEGLFEAAYGPKQPLGRPVICRENEGKHLNIARVRHHRDTYFTADRMVLVGAGIEHDQLVELAAKYFNDLPKSPGVIPVPQSKYVGGIVKRPILETTQPSGPLTHFGIAFESFGWTAKEVVAQGVLDVLMGGGSAFSAGGPGKGMYSRLYLETLNQHGWAESANAFTVPLKDVGMTGLIGSCAPAYAGNLVQELCMHLAKLCTDKVTPIELSRAKNQLRFSVMMNLEFRSILCEDIGRQVLMTNSRIQPDELCARIESVTADDLQRVARTAMSRPPTVVAIGDTHNAVPDYESFVSFFQQVMAACNNPSS